MLQVLNSVKAIYEAIEQGNIGKVISIVDENIVIYVAKSLGGEYRGREGVLNLISKTFSSSNNVKRIAGSFTVADDCIIVTGEVELKRQGVVIKEMPFVDIWKQDARRICEVEMFYLDAEEFAQFLREKTL